MQLIWPRKAPRGLSSPLSLADSRAAMLQALSGSVICSKPYSLSRRVAPSLEGHQRLQFAGTQGKGQDGAECCHRPWACSTPVGSKLRQTFISRTRGALASVHYWKLHIDGSIEIGACQTENIAAGNHYHGGQIHWNLAAQLSKMSQVASKESSRIPHSVLMVQGRTLGNLSLTDASMDPLT